MPVPHATEPLPLPRHFRLGDWTVDPRAGQLQRGDETVRLEPKVMGVLTHLAARAGNVVSRDELLDAVWPDVVVTENALSRCVSDLRRALGDDPRTPTLIETIPKTGYRMLVPPEPVEAPALLSTGDAVPAWAEITGPHPAAETVPAARRSPMVGWGILAVFVVVALGIALWQPWTSPSPPALTMSTPRPVTAQTGSEGLAALSPTGDRVAYVRFEEGGRMGRIEIVGTEGGTPLRLTEGPADTYPTFSPDGQEIAFLRCEATGCRPYRVSALGTDERLLADLIVQPAGLAWSPGGRTLATVRQATETNPFHLALLDLDTGEQRRLTTPPTATAGDIFPTFSPDGERLAFVRRLDDMAGDLHVISIGGGDPVAVSTDRSQVARFSWFPDSQRLLASSDRDGTFRLWQFSTTGASPMPLPLEVTMPIGPALSADGSRAVVESWDLPIQLRLYDLSDTETEGVALAPSTRLDRMPALSPDARRAVFVSTRSGYTELWTANLDGTPPRPLTSFAGPAVRTPQWSPDGHTIAFVMRGEGQDDLYTIPAEGGTPRRLTNTDADETHPRWAPDSRSLFVGRRHVNHWEGVHLAADGSREVVVVPDAVVLAPSPDGRTLWYTRADASGLWSLPLGSDGQPVPENPPSLALPDLHPEHTTAWSLTRDGLLYLRQTDGGATLVRWTDGHPDSTLGTGLHLDLWAPAFAASTDGSVLLVAQMGLPEMDVLIADIDQR